jgi:hypothetical protein
MKSEMSIGIVPGRVSDVGWKTKKKVKRHRATSRHWRCPDPCHVVKEEGGSFDQYLCHVVVVVKEEGIQIHVVGEEAINLCRWRQPNLRSPCHPPRGLLDIQRVGYERERAQKREGEREQTVALVVFLDEPFTISCG